MACVTRKNLSTLAVASCSIPVAALACFLQSNMFRSSIDWLPPALIVATGPTLQAYKMCTKQPRQFSAGQVITVSFFTSFGMSVMGSVKNNIDKAIVITPQVCITPQVQGPAIFLIAGVYGLYRIMSSQKTNVDANTEGEEFLVEADHEAGRARNAGIW